MAHRYFELPPGISAAALSELVYSICVPPGTDSLSKYAFGWVSAPGLPDLIEIDDQVTMPVFITDNFDKVITALDDILEPILYPEEGRQMVEYLRTEDRISFLNLIPQALQERSEDYLYLAGYRAPKTTSPI